MAGQVLRAGMFANYSTLLTGKTSWKTRCDPQLLKQLSDVPNKQDCGKMYTKYLYVTLKRAHGIETEFEHDLFNIGSHLFIFQGNQPGRHSLFGPKTTHRAFFFWDCGILKVLRG